MKRFFAFFLALIMLAGMLPVFSAQAYALDVAVSDFCADTADLTIGKAHEVTFTAEAKGVSSGGYISVYDNNNNEVAKLRDTGKNGDSVKGDSVFSAQVTLEKDTRENVTYSAKSNGKTLAEYDISFYKLADDTDLAVHDALWESIHSLENTCETRSISDSAKLTSVYNFVSSCPGVSSVSWENDTSFSFTFNSGITSVYAIWNDDTRGGENASSACGVETFLPDASAQKSDFVTWDDPDFVTFRPYRNTPSMGDFANDFYSGIARKVVNITGGTATDYCESQAYPGNLINVDKFGFFVIDSHGVTANGKAYMIMRAGNTSNYEYAADLSAGHIISTSGDVGVTGSFFTKYFTAQHKTLPGTLFYMVVCLGMVNNSIYSHLINLGAKLVVGYDQSVSFEYDFKISSVVWNYMVKPYPDKPTRNYTMAESIALGKQQCGNSDPYSSDRAKMVFQGSGNFVLSGASTAIESVTLSPNTCELYTNNTLQVSPVVMPEDATEYSVVYSVDNPSVAVVDGSGVITAKSAGNAVVTATVTDSFVPDNPITYTASCAVSVLGSLPVSGLYVGIKSLTLYTDNPAVKIDCHVIPENASNQAITFSSSDPSVVTVDGEGNVTAVSVGTAIITVTAVDGGYSSNIVCTAKTSGFAEAINAEGGNLNITNDSVYPWKTDISDGRMSVVCGNAGINSSASTVTLNAGMLSSGSKLVFDWKVSCEERWDNLSFRVNGAAISEIPDIYGLKDWATVTYTVPSDGEYTFTWAYKKDTSIYANADMAWLDNVDIIELNKQHTVTFFDIDKTTVISAQQVNHGSAAQAPDAPLHEGYSFVGWDTDFSAVRSDIDVYAIYEENAELIYHTVVFMGYDGVELKKERVLDGSFATAPAVPPVDGFVFIGWDKAFDNVTADITVTAEYMHLGDANLDGFVNTGDAVFVLKFSVGQLTMSDVQRLVADVNGNGEVNTGDAASILAIVVSAQ